jgi:hypothetical protein
MIDETIKRLDELIDYLSHSMRLDLPDATFLRRAYADQRSEIARLRKVEAAAVECLDAIRMADFQIAEKVLLAALASKPEAEGDKTIGEITAELAANAPNCPLHPQTRMVYADGMEHYHDIKIPHYRCELWIGGGVCGATLPLKPPPPPAFDDALASKPEDTL